MVHCLQMCLSRADGAWGRLCMSRADGGDRWVRGLGQTGAPGARADGAPGARADGDWLGQTVPEHVGTRARGD